MENQNEDKIQSRPTAEELADGKILLQIKHNFLKESSQENFVSLICCLRDSVMKVPVKMELSERSKENLARTIQEGKEEFQIDEEMQYFPMTLVNDEGKAAMAIFSNEEEIGNHYADADDIVFMDIPFVDCAAFFEEARDCDVLILDGFTEPFSIDREVARMLSEIKYKDESEDGSENQ